LFSLHSCNMFLISVCHKYLVLRFNGLA